MLDPSGLVRTLLCAALLAACGAPEPPPDDPSTPAVEPTIEVSPLSGAVGSSVEIVARGFQPNSDVLIGLGPPDSEYTELVREEADSDGTLRAGATVPDWVEVGRDYVWVVTAPSNRPRVVSEPFRVTGGN